jgi:hypothetical protein
MDRELLKALTQGSEDLKGIEYAQKCVEIYEETIRAMGLITTETRGEFVENSKLVYANSSLKGEEYAHIPEHH